MIKIVELRCFGFGSSSMISSLSATIFFYFYWINVKNIFRFFSDFRWISKNRKTKPKIFAFRPKISVFITLVKTMRQAVAMNSMLWDLFKKAQSFFLSWCHIGAPPEPYETRLFWFGPYFLIIDPTIFPITTSCSFFFLADHQ